MNENEEIDIGSEDHPAHIRKSSTPHPAKLTVVETVYFKRPNVGAESIKSNFEYSMPHPAGDEQPYIRRTKIGEQWEPLDVGWIDKCSVVVIRNESKKLGGSVIHVGIVYQVSQEVPTTEKPKGRTMWSEPLVKREPVANADTPTVRYESCIFAVVRPGETIRFSPSDVHALVIRSESGEVEYTVSAFPG